MSARKEEWRDIPGYEGFYQVSSLGRLCSFRDQHHKGQRLKVPVIELLLNMPLTPAQTETICRQAVDNFDDDRCHELCVQILQSFLMRRDGKLHAIESLFYDNRIHIHRDKAFLESIVEISDRCHFTSQLIKYIKESEDDISDYAEILVSIGKSLSCLSYWDIEAYVACIMRLFHSGRNNQEIKRACLDLWDTIFFTNPITIRPLADLLDNV